MLIRGQSAPEDGLTLHLCLYLGIPAHCVRERRAEHGDVLFIIYQLKLHKRQTTGTDHL